MSHIKFYSEDDDHKSVDFNGETINFTCRLIKITKSYVSIYKCTSFKWIKNWLELKIEQKNYYYQ